MQKQSDDVKGAYLRYLPFAAYSKAEILTCSFCCFLITVYGVLLGSQNGRDIDVQNSFEMAVRASSAPDAPSPQLEVDHAFLSARQAQCERWVMMQLFLCRY